MLFPVWFPPVIPGKVNRITVGVDHLLTKLMGTEPAEAPNALVTTVFDRCCHLEDIISAVIRWSLLMLHISVERVRKLFPDNLEFKP